MSDRSETLYQLLPALYRLRDQPRGPGQDGPLQALLTVLEEQVQALRGDMDGLYDNWFIETCEEWAVPYIAELLGVSGVGSIDAPGLSLRSFVANALSYRQRKGTSAVLEQLARDLTGWPAKLVEFGRLVATTQHLQSPRPDHVVIPRLTEVGKGASRSRKATQEQWEGPFATVPRLADLRPVKTETGPRYNLPNLGLFLWRLKSYRVEQQNVDASQILPYNYDIPIIIYQLHQRVLFVPGDRSAGIGFPVPLTHAALRAMSAEQKAQVIQVKVNGVLIGSDQIRDADLSLVKESLIMPIGDPNKLTLLLDPERGQMAFFTSSAQEVADSIDSYWTKPRPNVEVSYYVGFSGDVGAWLWDRESMPLDPEAKELSKNPEQIRTQLSEWQGCNAKFLQTPAKDGSGVYTVNFRSKPTPEPTKIQIPAGKHLELNAASHSCPILRARLDDENPQVNLNFELGAGATLVIRGFVLDSGLSVSTAAGNASANVFLEHCTSRSIVATGRTKLSLLRCMLDSTSIGVGAEIDAADCIFERSLVARTATLRSCTIHGKAEFDNLILASDCIFADTVQVRRTQQGCVRFSYVPDGSRVPHPYRCQPDLALRAATSEAERARILEQLRPRFTSTKRGQPGYTQLAADCDPRIRRGASGDGEMGAFGFLRQPQREANLRAALEEHVRVGYQLDLFYAT